MTRHSCMLVVALGLLHASRTIAQTPAELATAQSQYEEHGEQIRALRDARDWRGLIELYQRALSTLTPRGRDAARFNIALCYLELGECHVATRRLRSLTRSPYPRIASAARRELALPCPPPSE